MSDVLSTEERAAFEKWADPEMFDLVRHKSDSETYRNVLTRNAWDAWRARAKRDQHTAELARLLKYAAVHSSLAPHMNDTWREEALAVLGRLS